MRRFSQRNSLVTLNEINVTPLLDLAFVLLIIFVITRPALEQSMADSTEELPPEEQEVDGGAVKSFLEHLEDLRWMLVKSGAALLLGMCLCLFAVDELVAILKWPLDRAALIHENTETTQFFPGTFKNLPSMIARLKEPSDPVSSYLKERLSTKTIRMLADYGTDKVKPEVFQKSLIKDFNDIIDGDSIYTPERFKNVALRPETTNQMGKSSWFSKPVLLNRMLLEDAYPQEFSKNHFNGQRLTIFMRGCSHRSGASSPPSNGVLSSSGGVVAGFFGSPAPPFGGPFLPIDSLIVSDVPPSVFRGSGAR